MSEGKKVAGMVFKVNIPDSGGKEVLFHKYYIN